MNIDLSGIGVVNATSLHGDGSFDEDTYRRHLDWMVANGVRFVQPAAATGQAMALSLAEWKQIVEVTVGHLKGRCLVTAYTGRDSTEETVALTRLSRDLGVDCAYVIQPFFSRPDAEGLYRHYRAVADAVPDLPIVFYNNPGRAGVNLPIPVMARLAGECGNFVGLKQSNLEELAPSFARLSDRMVVWGKSELELLYSLSLGAPGSLTFAGNIIPGPLVRIVDLWNKGDAGAARSLFKRYTPLMQAIHLEPVPGCIKYMLKRLGWEFGPSRLPGHEVSAETAREIDRVMEALGDEAFA